MAAFRKQQLIIILMMLYFLICLTLLTGCLVSKPIPTATPTATYAPSSTPTPTPMPVFTLQNMDAQYPDGFLQFDPTFTGFQSRTYIIGSGSGFDSSENYYSSIYYTSLDRTHYGNLATFRNVLNNLLHYHTDSAYDESLSTNLEDPEYMNVVAGFVSVENINTINTDRISEMAIRSAKLRTGEQHIWKVIFHPESGMLCSGVSLSPDHEWVAGDCWKSSENSWTGESYDERYLYFLNIQQGTIKFLSSTQNPCSSKRYNSSHGWYFFDWSPNGQWFSASCETSHRLFTSCLISPESEEFSCRTDGYYRPEAWSPDSSKVAVNDHGDLLITDATCLKDAQACPEYFRSPLEPISGTPEFYSSHVAWDPTGRIVAWSIYATYVDGPGPTSIWVANLESAEKYHIDWAAGTEVYSISPDGKWILIRNDTEGWRLLSLNGSVELGINQELHDFLGWLVIP